MKKLTFTLLALVMALCCAFGLAACVDLDGSDTIAVTSVTLDKTELTLEIGDEETLTATVAPDDATNKTVSWSVSPAGVVTVDNGKVTAVAEGTATITATADGKSAVCAVTVKAATPQGSEVTATQWADILTGVSGYTCEASIDGEIEVTVEVDGDKIVYQQGRFSGIIVKDGDNYYRYEADGTAWNRNNIDEDDCAMYFEGAKVLQFFKDDYSKFTYSDDKYTCASLTNDGAENFFGEIATFESIDNVEVTFANGVLTGFAFDIVFEELTVHCEFIDIATTTVDLPTDYTDNTQSANTDLAGKTFVFSDAISEDVLYNTLPALNGQTPEREDVTEEILTQVKMLFAGATLTFGDDGNATLTLPTMDAVAEGLVTQEDGNIVIDFSEEIFYGNASCTFDGKNFYLTMPVVKDGDGLHGFTFTFSLQDEA